MMRKFVILCVWGGLLASLTGCNSTGQAAVESAGGKNLDLSGYVMYGDVETTDAVTNTPTGKLILGRMSYKSRKVGIPADWKVPTTGSFRSTKSKTLFGAEEMIMEYDFTAGSDKEAKTAMEALEKKRADALKAFNENSTDSEEKSE